MKNCVVRWSRALALLFIALCLLTLSGCVKESVNGSSKVYTIELWVPALIFVIGAVAAPAGYFLRETSDRLAWGLMIIGPIMALGVAPSLFLNKTVVSPEGITVRSGVWGMGGNHNVKFDNVQQVRHVVEETRGRRGRKNRNYYLVCDCKDGTASKLPLSNDCVEKAAIPFLTMAKEKNIPIVDEVGGGGLSE